MGLHQTELPSFTRTMAETSLRYHGARTRAASGAQLKRHHDVMAPRDLAYTMILHENL